MTIGPGALLRLAPASTLRVSEASVILKTWANGWATSSRYHEAAILPCGLGCDFRAGEFFAGPLPRNPSPDKQGGRSRGTESPRQHASCLVLSTAARGYVTSGEIIRNDMGGELESNYTMPAIA